MKKMSSQKNMRFFENLATRPEISVPHRSSWYFAWAKLIRFQKYIYTCSLEYDNRFQSYNSFKSEKSHKVAAPLELTLSVCRNVRLAVNRQPGHRQGRLGEYDTHSMQNINEWDKYIKRLQRKEKAE